MSLLKQVILFNLKRVILFNYLHRSSSCTIAQKAKRIQDKTTV